MSNPYYADVRRVMGYNRTLEKFAADARFTASAATDQAILADRVVTAMDYYSTCTEKLAQNVPLHEQRAMRMVKFARSLYDTHAQFTKVAGDPTPLFTKLAAAYMVDTQLTAALNQTTGAEKDAALLTRSLGREYILHLMGDLLA